MPHQRIMVTLESYGITGRLLSWIESFLTSRIMRVGIKGSNSEWIDVTSRVPQESILGPLLFLLFVNDLPGWIVSSMKMFADDIKLWHKISCESDKQYLQSDLQTMANWTQEWQLKLNPPKCKV